MTTAAAHSAGGFTMSNSINHVYTSWETAPESDVTWRKMGTSWDAQLSTIGLFWRPESRLTIDDDSVVIEWDLDTDKDEYNWVTVSARYYAVK